MTADAEKPTPTQMTIEEMKHFMLGWHAVLMAYNGGPAPAGAFFVMPAADIARVGIVVRFFETIEPHADDVRRAVAAAMKRKGA